jgi:hypothetical protein
LAVALDADAQMVSGSQASAEKLSTALNSVLRVRWVRPWGFPFGKDGFKDAINDLATVGIFKPGPRNQRTPSIEMLEGKWELF